VVREAAGRRQVKGNERFSFDVVRGRCWQKVSGDRITPRYDARELSLLNRHACRYA